MQESFYQTQEWEEFKLKTGYQKSYRIGDILVLQREIAFGKTMLYSPMVNSDQLSVTSNQQNDFIKEITKIGKENSSIFYRLELDTQKSGNWKLETGNWTKSFEEMQPENNWVVDLTKTEEELLSQMKQKCRYNIKVAQKSQVKITSSNKTGKEFEIFYDQYSSTGKRHKVTFRSKEYFSSLLEIMEEKGYARVYAATTVIEGKEVPLASAVMIFYSDEIQYLYGGSSNDHKNLMAPYLLHWQMMLDAKKEGFKKYNFLGVAPDDNPNHPWAGITRFKKQFGGYQHDIEGCYDLVFKPLEYKLFKIAEKIRR